MLLFRLCILEFTAFFFYCLFVCLLSLVPEIVCFLSHDFGTKITELETEKEDTELPVFQLSVVVAATKNFSLSNRIGEGGFGPVYKVPLFVHLEE